MSDENLKNEETGTPETEPVTTTDAPAEAPTEEGPEPTVPEVTGTDAAIEVTEEDRKNAVVLPHRDLRSGMVVRVHEVIKDVNAKGEERERVQIFEGMIIGISGKEISRTMTVRKVSKGYGVEKIYPLSSPHVAKVEVIKQMRVRRSKLAFMRHLFKRRLKERA